MELFQIKAFLEIANTGSFTKAGERLAISQPGLTKQISNLENELGLELFSRHSRGVTLTNAGKQIYSYFNDIVNLVKKTEKVIEGIKGLEDGTLSIGASTTIGNYLVPTWLAQFTKVHPHIQVDMVVENTSLILQNVINHKIDLGLIAGPIKSPDFSFEPLFDDTLLLMSGQSHSLANDQEITPRKLNNQTFILRENGSSTRLAAEALLESLDINPKKIITMSDTEAIKRSVMAGLGISILSEFTVEIEVKYGLLCSLNKEFYHNKRTLYAIYPKYLKPSPAVLAFLKIIKSGLGFTAS